MPMLSTVLDSRIRDLLPELERVYTDIHAHPELSMQETRTARIAADHLRGKGYDVTDGIGDTGRSRRDQDAATSRASDGVHSDVTVAVRDAVAGRSAACSAVAFARSDLSVGRPDSRERRKRSRRRSRRDFRRGYPRRRSRR